MPKRFNRYAEIFFGGGALFWSVSPQGSLIADSNPELIGFYRVNRQGRFNTPFGHRTNVTILQEENLLRASELLKSVEIVCGDFIDTLAMLREGDFVYLDPPYLPLGGYADFRRYTKDCFNEEHHVRLAVEFGELKSRGIKALLSNSATKKIADLYKSFHPVTVMAPRYINCRGTGRKRIRELLVANYPIEVEHVLS